MLSSPTLTGHVDLGAGEATAPVSSRARSPRPRHHLLLPGGRRRTATGTARGDVDYFAPEPAGNRALVVNCRGRRRPRRRPGKMTIRAAVARVESGGASPSTRGSTARRIDLVDRRRDRLDPAGRGVHDERGASGCSRGTRSATTAASALYADRSLTIDASALPNGITLAWAGGDASHARVLAVYGDLTMSNVTVTGGYAEAVPLPGDYPAQPYTLARGGGVAVWGTATLDQLRPRRQPGRRRQLRRAATAAPSAAAIYADTVDLTGCVVSGNSVTGYGGAGGGVYSVGGRRRPAMDSSPEPHRRSPATGSPRSTPTAAASTATAAARAT